MAPASDTLHERVARLPRQPGVYLWKDASGGIVYVGKAADLRGRVASYLDPASARTSALMAQAVDLDFIAVRNEKEALVLEQTLIKRHRPRYNVRLNDDKQYPYIVLTDEPYPRLVKVHRYGEVEGTHYGPFPDGYGAFHVMQAMLDLLPLRRCRTLPKQKCLYYDIGKCIAPCIAACTDAEYDVLVAEARDLLSGRSDHMVSRLRGALEQAAAEHRFEAAARLRDQLGGLEGMLERQLMTQERLEDRDIAAACLRGDQGVVAILHQRDGKVVGQSVFGVRGAAGASEAQALEEFLLGYYKDRGVPRHVAADLPDDGAAQRLEAQLRLLSGRAVDVEAPRKGDKRRWVEVAQTNARLRAEQEEVAARRRGMGAVETLQRGLGLAQPPRRIEGFDVSHQAGEFTRAALVTFADGEPDKQGYRTFKMRTVGATAVRAGTAESKGHGREVDDFLSIREAVLRRYRGVQERGEPLPDLVLVDGGPGQLAAARSALQEAGLPDLPACALAKREELVHLPGRIHPLRLRRDDAGLHLLQRVRDEAHRFGIRQVRRKAGQAVAASPLDEVPGIGPRRRALLVTAFGGLEGLRAASVEDLQRVPGVTAAMAQRIVEALGNGEAAVQDAAAN